MANISGVSADATSLNSSYPQYNYEARVALAAFWILFTIAGFTGSSLVIWSVVLSKKLRTVTNAFVVNLSVADFWTSLSYPWLAVAGLSTTSWPLTSEIPCRIAAVQFDTGFGASLYILAAIAVNRMVMITQPIDIYRWLYTPRKVAVMIAATWILPWMVVGIPPLCQAGQLGFDITTRSCSIIESDENSANYKLTQTLGMYPIPMIIIISSYTALYVNIRRHFKQQRRRHVITKTPTVEMDLSDYCKTDPSRQSLGPTISSMSKSNIQAIKRQQLAITKNLFLICLTFTSLVSPYFLSLAAPHSSGFTPFAAAIATINSCVSPIIYTCNHPDFKVIFPKMLKCRYSEIPEPSDFLKYFLSRRKPGN